MSFPRRPHDHVDGSGVPRSALARTQERCEVCLMAVGGDGAAKIVIARNDNQLTLECEHCGDTSYAFANSVLLETDDGSVKTGLDVPSGPQAT